MSEEVQERIKFELHIMKTMGFPGYFLIVQDFIRAAREELDVSVGPGRGSAAGSAVAYCLFIRLNCRAVFIGLICSLLYMLYLRLLQDLLFLG